MSPPRPIPVGLQSGETRSIPRGGKHIVWHSHLVSCKTVPTRWRGSHHRRPACILPRISRLSGRIAVALPVSAGAFFTTSVMARCAMFDPVDLLSPSADEVLAWIERFDGRSNGVGRIEGECQVARSAGGPSILRFHFCHTAAMLLYPTNPIVNATKITWT